MVGEILSISGMSMRIEVIDTEIEYIQGRLERLWLATQPKATTIEPIPLKGNTRQEKFLNYVWRVDDENLEYRLTCLIEERREYLNKVERQLKSARKYNEYLESIIFYRDIYRDVKTGKQLTWEQIAREKVHLSRSSCIDIYKRYKKRRNI